MKCRRKGALKNQASFAKETRTWNLMTHASSWCLHDIFTTFTWLIYVNVTTFTWLDASLHDFTGLRWVRDIYITHSWLESYEFATFTWLDAYELVTWSWLVSMILLDSGEFVTFTQLIHDLTYVRSLNLHDSASLVDYRPMDSERTGFHCKKVLAKRGYFPKET